jgi:5,10-methylenetetrahydromethanopterin reductase
MTLRTGLLLLPSRPALALAELAERAEGLGYDDLWVADERFFREAYGCLALCAARTRRIRLGPGVTDPYSRHPALTAMAMATLDEIAGGRAVLGIGAGVDATRSATAIREAVELIRRLLARETVTYRGREIDFHDGRLDFAPPRPHLPIYVASQRAAGCRVAGRVADGAIMQGCVAEPLVEFFRESVYEGAQTAGRDPATIDLVARLNVCVADDRKAARDAMRPGLVRSLVAQRPDFFTFVQAGLTLPAALREQVLALPYTHDPAPLRALALAVPDEFVDAMTLTGPADEVAKEVRRLALSGITQILVFPVGVDGAIETTVERFQWEVMPRVREGLG